MSKRKTFKRGDLVEVQREPGNTVTWEPAAYREYAGNGPETMRMPGHHVVDLDPSSPARYIDPMSGMEVPGPDRLSNPRAYATRVLTVPSRRIRARSMS